MTRTFCNRCGREIYAHQRYRVTVWFENDPKPPTERRNTGDICVKCAKPAIDLVLESVENDQPTVMGAARVA